MGITLKDFQENSYRNAREVYGVELTDLAPPEFVQVAIARIGALRINLVDVEISRLLSRHVYGPKIRKDLEEFFQALEKMIAAGRLTVKDCADLQAATQLLGGMITDVSDLEMHELEQDIIAEIGQERYEGMSDDELITYIKTRYTKGV